MIHHSDHDPVEPMLRRRRFNATNWLYTISGLCMIGLAGVLLWAVGPLSAISIEFDPWDKAGAEQYRIATEDGGKWGEIIHEYQDRDCEAHRWRYLGAYYIGHVGTECGDLVIERITSRR